MANANRQSRTGATPRQLALVAVLSVVFVAVLIVQFGGGSGAEQAAEPPRASEGRVQTPPVATAAVSTETPEQHGRLPPSARPWPAPELEEVLSHDPFAVPAGFSKRDEAADPSPKTNREREAAARRAEALQRQAEQDRALTKLREQGVRAVVGTTKSGRVAIVGSQLVRVGDVLEGFRVIAIEPDGLVLRLPLAEQPSPKPE